MITLRKIAYEFRRMEAGGDPGPDFHISIPYAILLARQCFNVILKQSYWEAINNDDRSGGMQMVIVGYEVDVLGENDHKYIALPEFFLNLPFNTGLKGIAPIEEPSHEFIPRNTPSVSYNLPCGDVQQQMSYYQEGMRVMFDKAMDLAKVLVKLRVGAPDSITEDMSLPIYPEQQHSILMLMRATMANAPIQDKIIDNNKDIGTRIPR
jgi:hypothetical protein